MRYKSSPSRQLGSIHKLRDRVLEGGGHKNITVGSRLTWYHISRKISWFCDEGWIQKIWKYHHVTYERCMAGVVRDVAATSNEMVIKPKWSVPRLITASPCQESVTLVHNFIVNQMFLPSYSPAQPRPWWCQCIMVAGFTSGQGGRAAVELHTKVHTKVHNDREGPY